MIKVNSLSGGKTSSYMAVHYPAAHNVFSYATRQGQRLFTSNHHTMEIIDKRSKKPSKRALETGDVVEVWHKDNTHNKNIYMVAMVDKGYILVLLRSGQRFREHTRIIEDQFGISHEWRLVKATITIEDV